MTIEIDEATGLPVLPEGQRWLVRKEMQYLSTGWDGYSPKVQTGNLEVVLQTGVDRVIGARAVPTGKRRWYGRKIYQMLPPEPYTEWTDLRSQVMEGKHPIAVFNAACKIIKQIDKDNAVNALLGAYPPKTIKEERA